MTGVGTPTGARVGFIVGPTGAGKTALALAVAERLGAEIVNADSRQVYRGMDLGTAKPTAAEQGRVPHHLIDIRTPDNPLDVAEFADLAKAAIAQVSARGRPVLIVGGSGLYLRVLRDGIFAGPPAAPAIRAELTTFSRQHGTPALHAQLATIDATAAARISPNDLQRIVRALEVFHLTGTPISAHHERHRFATPPYTSLTVGVTMPRELLYAAIDRRFVAMVAAGLLDEVRGLLVDGHEAGTAPLVTIGYSELAAHLRGATDLPTAIANAQRASRQLAKRQLTWFRADPSIVWLDARTALEPALRLFHDFFDRQKESDG
ncbi:MAG TPA: tRNA (adenosine(37)-N6)-dimethylallyltransferase MiaA [Candidatus Binataceae bacterium]|nr:tRNA (adenosine(37)-N6)-dimethylallyltransferase MiaA [Candidatus Binataceae bacterium]